MTIFWKEYKIVFEKDQKDKANTLYLYIENIDGVTYAKFGEAFKQTVWERYDATGYTQHSKQIKVWKSSIGDKPIHRLLRSMFTWAGVGTMLLYAVEKYGFKKEDCYGIDIDEDNVKICKKLI